MKDPIVLKIERINFRGEGLGVSACGERFRVSNAMASETVEALDVSTNRRKIAYLVRVVEPAEEAQPPMCEHWRDCAACQYCRMALEAQRTLKREHWLRLIGRFVDLTNVDNIQFLAANEALGYRHRARARFLNGFFVMPVRLDAQTLLEERSVEPNIINSEIEIESSIALHDCRLHAFCLNALMRRLELLFNREEDASLFEYDVEAFEESGRVTIYAAPEVTERARVFARALAEGVLGTCDEPLSIILQPVPARGSHVYPPAESFGKTPYYGYTRNCAKELLMSLSGSWTPVNPTNADKIRDILIGYVEKIDHEVVRVLELGCGCGTHADVFERFEANYHGVDASWPAIKSASYNAQKHGWKNKTFQTSTALHYLDKNYYKGARADIVLMHSNRMPYGADVAMWCKKFGARTILIVAPTAYAMAAECQHFVELGYTLRELTLCDTLPYTYHMMAVARLCLQDAVL